MATSCTSLQEVSLDVMQPAPVTLPVYARSVAVAAVAAPETKIEGQYRDPYGRIEKLDFDTAVDVSGLVARNTAKAMRNARYFSRTELCNPVPAASPVKAIKDSTAASVVLLLDSVVLHPMLTDYGHNDWGYLVSEFRIKGDLFFTLYIGDDEPPQTWVISDSIRWESFGTTPENRYHAIPEIGRCLNEFAQYAGYCTVRQFVPESRQADRFYFKTSSSLMKDAHRYWQTGQYDEASYLWEYLYETGKSDFSKAMAAANLALYCELCDNFIQAREWVKVSIALFGPETEGGKRMTAYLQEIEQRIADEEHLRFQLL